MPTWTPPLTTNQQIALAIIPKITASLSIVGSVYILQHVLRSPKRRALCYHRLLLGMSLMDVISSFKSFLSTWILPRETGAWGAVGTIGTCTAAGFFGQGSSIASPLYNGSLALFYLLTVRYGWKDDASGAYGGGNFATTEPWMHAVPLTFGWGTAIAGIPLTLYNPIGWTCWIGAVPQGCDRDPSVPCERGDNAYIYRWAFFHAELWLTFVVVAVIMFSMYKSVRNKERKSNRYTYSHNRQRASPSQSRRVAAQALLYVFAYYVTWVFPAVTWLTQIIQGKTYTPILLLQAFFVPLQGFFNAFVYLRPRYLRYRRIKPNSPRWRVVISTLAADFGDLREKESTSQHQNDSAPGVSNRRDTDFHTLNESTRGKYSVLKHLSSPKRFSASNISPSTDSIKVDGHAGKTEEEEIADSKTKEVEGGADEDDWRESNDDREEEDDLVNFAIDEEMFE